ncbi:MAG: hypothetical protein RLZZ28_326 [Bacteroidota bacterium]|jgi:hypothetical protein
MNISSVLDKLYLHAFDMVKFGETKNTALIAFNGAIILGMAKLAADAGSIYVYYYALFAIAMCVVSIFICFSALIAKIKQKPNDFALPHNDNPLFFATVAHMTHEELIAKLTSYYGCVSESAGYETDLAKQAIITSQIASRKYKLFNIAIGFTFSGIATPVSILFYLLLLNRD